MPTKNSSSTTTDDATKDAKPGKKAAAKKSAAKGSTKSSPPPAPVVVSRVHHSPALYDAARDELRSRGLPVELVRITPVPGRQVVDVDVTPRPALNARR